MGNRHGDPKKEKNIKFYSRRKRTGEEIDEFESKEFPGHKYLKIRRLGEGGQGTVDLVKRLDPEGNVSCYAALKIIKLPF